MKVLSSDKKGFWRKSHHLDRMTLDELVRAYFAYPAIIAYLACSVVAIGLWAWRPAPLPQTLAAIAVAVLVYFVAPWPNFGRIHPLAQLEGGKACPPATSGASRSVSMVGRCGTPLTPAEIAYAG